MVNEKKEFIKGGKADYRPDSDFDPEELRLGREHERKDHGGTEDQIDELVKDHLAKDSKYYSKLKKKEQEKEKNNESFDIAKYRAWLANTEKETTQSNTLLKENKLSSAYWKKRGSQRAKESKRKWPNAKDKNWASLQQERSTQFEKAYKKIFENELEATQEMKNIADQIVQEVRKKRKQMKSKMYYKKFGPGMPNKPKGNVSVPLGPEYGGVAKGYKKKLKKLKRKGIAGIAPGEAFGPMQEGAVLNEFSVKELTAAYEKIKDFLEKNLKNFDLSKITTSVVSKVLQLFNNKDLQANSNQMINFFNQISQISERRKRRGRISPDIERFIEFLIPYINKYGLLPIGIFFLYKMSISGSPPPTFVIDMIYAGVKSMDISDFLSSYFDDPAKLAGLIKGLADPV